MLATHGIGEAPEGSEEFFDFWLADKAPLLKQLSYSVLALGDSSYADFCEMGRVFDARLDALGATAFAPRVDCDLDFQANAESWVSNVVEHARSETAETAETAETTIVQAAHLTAVRQRRHTTDRIRLPQRSPGSRSSLVEDPANRSCTLSSISKDQV